jgi:hypothetical protein
LKKKVFFAAKKEVKNMRITIEIEKDEEIEKIKIFKGESITVVKSQRERNKILESIFRKYNVKLPKDYSFDREAIHARKSFH